MFRITLAVSSVNMNWLLGLCELVEYEGEGGRGRGWGCLNVMQ